MKRIIYLLGLAIFLALLNQSCIDEKDFDFDRIATTTLNPTLGIGHVASIEVSLLDLINFQEIADSTGIALETVDDGFGPYMVFSIRYDSLIRPDIPKLNDISGISTNIELDLPRFNSSIIAELYYPSLDEEMEEISIDLPELEDGQIIDRIKLSKGSVYIAIANDLNHEAYIELYSPNLKKADDNSEFRENIQISNANQAGMAVINTSIDLSEYEIINNQNNVIKFYYRVYIRVNGMFNTDYNINLDVEFSQIEFDYIYGSIGNFVEEINDMQEIDLFADSAFSKIFKAGVFEFDNIHLDLDITTNIGIPAEININKVETYTEDGLSENLIDPRVIAITPTQSHLDPITTSERIDINSNAISIFPSKIEYDAEVSINKNNTVGFISNDAYLRLKSKLTFPFRAKINDLVYDIEMDEIDLAEISEYINQAKLYLDIKNGFPFSLDVQIITLDDYGNVMDSVFTTPFKIDGAPTDSYGRVSDYESISYIRNEVMIDNLMFEKLRIASKSKIRLTLNSSVDGSGSKPFIRLSNDAKLGMKLGFDIEANISF